MRKIYLLASILVSACASAPITERLPSSMREGGADGGGGNALAYPMATKLEVEKAVQLLPKMIWMVMAYHEHLHELAKPDSYGNWPFVLTRLTSRNPDVYFSVDSPALRRAYQKLFSGDAIFNEIKRVKFVPRASGPCQDQRFAHKDASAFNANSDEICFSVPRLQSKLRYDNLGVEILALAGHELTHRVGGSEEEAVALQKAILFTLVPVDLTRLSGLMNTPSMLGRFTTAIPALLDSELDSDQKAALCHGISAYRSDFNAHMAQILSAFPLGFSFARLRGTEAVTAADMQTHHMGAYCRQQDTGLPTPSPHSRRELLKIKGNWGGAVWVTDPEQVVMRGVLFGLDELRFNFEQSQKSLETLRKNVQPR